MDQSVKVSLIFARSGQQLSVQLPRRIVESIENALHEGLSVRAEQREHVFGSSGGDAGRHPL